MSAIPEISTLPVDELSYEEAFAQLEIILQRLEEDDLPLEKSLTLYERGVILTDYCTKVLDTAELRVRKWQVDGQTTPLDHWQEG